MGNRHPKQSLIHKAVCLLGIFEAKINSMGNEKMLHFPYPQKYLCSFSIMDHSVKTESGEIDMKTWNNHLSFQRALPLIVLFLGCRPLGRICDKVKQSSFEVEQSVDLYLLNRTHHQICWNDEHSTCSESGFAPDDRIITEGLQDYLTCEHFCDKAHTDRVIKVSSCELNIDWNLVPAEYIQIQLWESSDTDSEIDYYGFDWEQSYGTLSCTGKSTDPLDCTTLNYYRD